MPSRLATPNYVFFFCLLLLLLLFIFISSSSLSSLSPACVFSSFSLFLFFSVFFSNFIQLSFEMKCGCLPSVVKLFASNIFHQIKGAQNNVSETWTSSRCEVCCWLWNGNERNSIHENAEFGWIYSQILKFISRSFTGIHDAGIVILWNQ